MPSKLQTFLAANKIDQRQLLAVSHGLEALRPEDRAIRLAKKRGAKAEGEDKEKTKNAGKPRSGRPLTPVGLGKIFGGKPVTGPTRTRVLRAVNAILERRKKDKVELAAIFDLATEKAVKGKKKVEKKKG
jgi:hypothetical protein